MGEKVLLPDTPHLSITLQAPIELSLTLPYPIRFTIRRLARGYPTDSQPCIIRWNPTIDAFSPPSGLVLLRHSLRNGGGCLEPIPVNHASGDPTGGGEDCLIPTGEDNQFWWELPAPGSEISVTATLPERYYRAINQAGGSFGPWGVYMLLFPGAELGVWDWGAVREHAHSGQGVKEGGAGMKLVVPGGARIHFTVVRFSDRRWPERDAYEAEHGFERANVAQREWRDREERKVMANRSRLGLSSPVELSDRMSGAPHFTVAVKGPVTVKSYEQIRVNLEFTYHGITGADGNLQTSTARPVAFHSWAFSGQTIP
ncbi:hypothetical protein C8A01DRAFT_40164 [Parachaetomium inaequale]|uniref:Uncharacterized protein n=1 Tax=Parachaetomium inaequale TaxID=2588326 RepID=A0AAN6PCB1_9PEZI|nr:hypothetical protein C8A01DRAFT_40164 [Parachaetomium inaequale]